MIISRRKLLSSLSALLGISLVPGLALAEPIPDLVVGNSIDFPCRYVVQSRLDIIENALYLLERGFEIYDEHHNTFSIGQAKAVIDLSFRQQRNVIENICKNAAPNQAIGFWISVNLTKGRSESGIRLMDGSKRASNTTPEDFMKLRHSIDQEDHRAYLP